MEKERIVRTVIRSGQHPTEAQIREILLASSKPAIPDEDTPELTLTQIAEITTISKNLHSQK